MRILHINKAYSITGGVEKYLRDIVNVDISGASRVDVLAVSDNYRGRKFEIRNGSVIECSRLFKFSSAPISISFALKFFWMCRSYDILHFHYPNPLGEVMMILSGSLLRNKKVIVTYHNDVSDEKPFSSTYNFIVGFFFKLCDVIVVTSPNLGRSASALRAFQDKLEVIPLGIHLETTPNHSLSLDSRASTNVLQLLFVGRLSAVKGVDVLIKSISGLEVNLVIVGNGDLRQELEVLARDVNANVEFWGGVSDKKLQGAYGAADVFILPSVTKGEGFGYVILEAMAHGCAIISTELGTGTSYINQNEITGLVVRPSCVEELSQAIIRLQRNRDELESFATQAQKRVLDFSFDNMVSKLEAVYRSNL